MGQVSGRTWVDGDRSMATGLVQIDDGSLRKKEGFVGCGERKKRWRGSEERETEKG